jgi:hypothetical protein
MLTRRQPHKAAHKPRGPIRHGGLGTVSLCHLRGIGLDMILAALAPNDQPDAGGGSIAERHRRAAAPGLWGPERRRELRRYPPERNDAVAPRLVEISPQDPQPEKLLETDNSPVPAEPMSVPAVKKAGPRKADNCGHCGKPLATLRSAGSRYCDRYCAKAARKARATELWAKNRQLSAKNAR